MGRVRSDTPPCPPHSTLGCRTGGEPGWSPGVGWGGWDPAQNPCGGECPHRPTCPHHPCVPRGLSSWAGREDDARKPGGVGKGLGKLVWAPHCLVDAQKEPVSPQEAQAGGLGSHPTELGSTMQEFWRGEPPPPATTPPKPTPPACPLCWPPTPVRYPCTLVLGAQPWPTLTTVLHGAPSSCPMLPLPGDPFQGPPLTALFPPHPPPPQSAFTCQPRTGPLPSPLLLPFLCFSQPRGCTQFVTPSWNSWGSPSGVGGGEEAEKLWMK